MAAGAVRTRRGPSLTPAQRRGRRCAARLGEPRSPTACGADARNEARLDAPPARARRLRPRVAPCDERSLSSPATIDAAPLRLVLVLPDPLARARPPPALAPALARILATARASPAREPRRRWRRGAGAALRRRPAAPTRRSPRCGARRGPRSGRRLRRARRSGDARRRPRRRAPRRPRRRSRERRSRGAVGHAQRALRRRRLAFPAPRPDAWFVRAAGVPCRSRRRPLARRRPRRAALPARRRCAALAPLDCEMQMLLHEHPVNPRAKPPAAPPVTGLWLSGGGRRRRARALRDTAARRRAGAAATATSRADRRYAGAPAAPAALRRAAPRRRDCRGRSPPAADAGAPVARATGSRRRGRRSPPARWRARGAGRRRAHGVAWTRAAPAWWQRCGAAAHADLARCSLGARAAATADVHRPPLRRRPRRARCRRGPAAGARAPVSPRAASRAARARPFARRRCRPTPRCAASTTRRRGSPRDRRARAHPRSSPTTTPTARPHARSACAGCARSAPTSTSSCPTASSTATASRRRSWRSRRSATPHLIVTVDNGIASVDGVAAAAARGIDVLITDHHLPGRDAAGARDHRQSRTSPAARSRASTSPASA